MSNFNKFLEKYKGLKLSFVLRPRGFVPKSGLFLAEYFLENRQKYSRALEIGVGEAALLPVMLIKAGLVKNIDATDPDPSALEWSKKNINNNSIQKKVKVYPGFYELSEYKYDLIYSNPPQLPVPVNTSIHDDGGVDGYEIINQIINYAQTKLVKNGRLVLLAFDFLNVENSFNKKITLLGDLSSKGFDVVVKKRIFKKVRTGGRVEKNLDWIKKQYPLYDFRKNGQLGYWILIIEAIKR